MRSPSAINPGIDWINPSGFGLVSDEATLKSSFVLLAGDLVLCITELSVSQSFFEPFFFIRLVCQRSDWSTSNIFQHHFENFHNQKFSWD